MSNNLNKRTYDEKNDNKHNDYSSDGSNQSDNEKIKAPKKKFKKFSSNKSSKVNKKKSSKKESSDEESETDDDDYNSSNSEMDQGNETEDEDDNWESENKHKSKNKKESRKQGKHEKKSKKLSIVIAKRPAKKNDSDEESFKENTSDVEDGEVSDTDNNSDNNGNTSSSSSIFNDGYDNDLIGDEEDRKNLDSMTEKEREMEIYRRTEQREQLLRQFEMKKKIKQKAMKNEKTKKKMDKKKKKSTKKSNDESDSYKKDNDDDFSNDEKNNGSPGSPTSTMMDRRKANESKRKDTHVSKALANLKADREKKKQQAEEIKQRTEKIEQQPSNSQKKRNDDIYSSSPSSSSFSKEDEDDSDNKRSRNKKRNDKNSSDSSSESSDSDSVTDPKSKQQITSKDDLTQIKLSRFRISKWCHAPFFKKLATGCFVRIGIGMNQGNSIYRVAEITDVVETAKVYELEATKTNKGFKLRHGEEERTYRLAFVSNQPFTDLEFLRWKEAMNKEGNPLPTKGEVEAKAKEIQTYNNYRYNDDDFDFIIKEKKRFNKGNENIAVKKMELLTEREESEQRNDIERMNEIDNLLSDLNEKATDLNTKRSGNFINFADINRRNREISNAKAEEAMKQEFERLKEQKDDPFQRRKGFPTLVATAFKKNLAQEQKTAETQKVVDEEKEKKEKADPLKKNNSAIFEDLLAPNIPDLKKNEANKQNEKLNQINPNDLFHAHNFEININLSEPGHATASLPPAVNGNILNSNSSQLSRRGLNLDEYKKKKGLF